MKKILLLLALLGILVSFKHDKPAYRIFTQDGKTVKYQKMLKELSEADVVFFGELHNNPICHWLQLATDQTVSSNLIFLMSAATSALVWPFLFQILRHLRRGFSVR